MQNAVLLGKLLRQFVHTYPYSFDWAQCPHFLLCWFSSRLAAAILKHSCFWRRLFTSSVSFLSFEAESLWKLIAESLEQHQRRGAVLSDWHFQPAPFREFPALKRPWPQAFGLHWGWNTEISAPMPFKDIVFSMHLLLLNALHYFEVL